MYLAACGQTGESPKSAAASEIAVRDGNKTVATVVAGPPCRATFDGVEVNLSGWTGEDGDNGTMIFSDGVYVARLFNGSLFDAQGIATARVAVTGDTAKVSDAASRPIRTLTRDASAITSDTLAITGTDDLGLAALLVADARPEIRAFAACRMLAGGTK